MRTGNEVEGADRVAPETLVGVALPLAPATPPGETVLRRAVLIVAIGLSSVLGYLTAHALFLLIGLVFLYFALLQRGVRIDFELPARLFLAAFTLLFLSALATARQPTDLILVLGFAPMLLYAPLATLFRHAADPRNSRKVGDFALFGVAAGVLFALFYTYVLHIDRAGLGSPFTDPIRLSNTALLVGFIAMIGAAASSGRQRFIYLLGPLMALVVIFASGSRAALVAFPALLFVAALLLVPQKFKALGISLLLLLGFGVVAYLADLAGARSSSTLVDVTGMLAGGDDPADLGLTVRLILYRAGLASFIESPLFGHGWGQLMSSIVPYLAPDELIHARFPHLHDDALNFAVAAGVLGLAVYLLLLLVPVLACLNSPRDSQYRTRLYGCSLLSIGYLVLGLPDTMLSFPMHNALYVVLTAMLLNYCRDRPTA